MFQLRPYQQRVVDLTLAHLHEYPNAQPLIVAPCAAGKSVIIADLCMKLSAMTSGMVLVMTHRKELVAQTASKLPGHMKIGVFSAGLRRKELRKITIAGFQSLRRHAAKLPSVSYILIDEAEFAQKGYREFIDEVRERSPKLRVIGLTATPYLGDANRTALHLLPADKQIFTGIAAEIQIGELLALGYLSPLVPYKGKVHLDTTGVALNALTGDFAVGALEAAVDTDLLNEQVAREIVAIFAEREAVMVFASGVSHALHLRDALRKHGVEAECVLGDTPSAERDRLIERFRAGKLKFIVGVDVLLVGFDAPIMSGIAMLRPTLSSRVYVQACLDLETEILTSHGWKNHSEMRVGDCAMTLDEETGKGVWSQVEEVIYRPMHSSEKWVQYNAPRANFRVTDGHRMLYEAATWRNGFEKRTGLASEMAALKNGVRMPTAVSVDQPGVPLTNDELYFIGIMMTDGSWSSRQASISQSERHPEILKKIEATLVAMGVGYSKRKRPCYPNDSGSFVERYPRWIFSITMNFSRKGLRGFSYLVPYLSKDLAPALFAMSALQFEKLLDGLYDGDGYKINKAPSCNWTPRSRTICTARKLEADRLQALGAMNGYTVHFRSEQSASRKRPLYVLTFTPKNWRNVGGSGNRPQIEVSPATNEHVWCVRTGTGTIVTRRKGKVTVMGNCGRGMRVHPGKTCCLVCDFTDSTEIHGPIDEIEGNAPKLKTGEAPTKMCDTCFSIVLAGLKVCPTCGTEFPVGVNNNQQQFDPMTGLLISGVTKNEDGTKTYPVERVAYEIRVTNAGHPALVANYLSPGRLSPIATEYYNLWHHSAATVRRDSDRWLRRQSFAGGSIPLSAQEALARAELGALKLPKSVTIRPGSPWPIRFSA